MHEAIKRRGDKWGTIRSHMCTYQSRYHTVIFSKSYIVIKIRLYHCIPCNKILKPRTHLNVFFVWNIFLTRNKFFLTLSALQLNHRAASSKYKTCIHKLRIGHFKKHLPILSRQIKCFHEEDHSRDKNDAWLHWATYKDKNDRMLTLFYRSNKASFDHWHI